MITLLALLILCGLILFLVWNKYHANVIYAYPLIGLFLEMSRTILIKYELPPGFNSISLIVYIYLLYNTKLRIKDFKGVYFLLFIYTLIVVFFTVQTDFQSDGVFNGFSRIFRFLFIFAFFFIGYACFKNLNNINYLNRNIFISGVIFIIITFLMSFLSFGDPLYSGGIIYGYIQGEMHFAPLFVVLSFLMLYLNKYSFQYKLSNKQINIALILMLVIVVISLMRTTWIILGLGIISIILLSHKNSKFTVKYILIFLVAIIVLAVYLVMTDMIGARARVFSDTYEFQDEGRFREVFLINNFYLTDFKSRLFGTGKMFGPVYTFGLYDYDYRQLHGTYTRIYHGSGLIGIFLFITFFLSILFRFIFVKNNQQIIHPKLYKVLKGTGVGLMLGYMFAAISGATVSAMYPPLCFLYMGALMGILKQKNKDIHPLKDEFENKKFEINE